MALVVVETGDKSMATIEAKMQKSQILSWLFVDRPEMETIKVKPLWESPLRRRSSLMLEFHSCLEELQEDIVSSVIVPEMKDVGSQKYLSSSWSCHQLFKNNIAYRTHMWGGNEMGNAHGAYFWGGYQGYGGNQNLNPAPELGNGANNDGSEDDDQDPEEDEVVPPVMDETGKILCVHCLLNRCTVNRFFPGGLRSHIKDVHFQGGNVRLQFCNMGCQNYFPVGERFERHQATYAHRG